MSLLFGAAPAPMGPPESILLFVASWCAPCHGELARLEAIGRGAQPYRILVVAFDDSRATRAMLERVPLAQRWQPDRAIQRRLAAEVARRSAGLPFSLALNSEAQICAGHPEALDATSAAAMVAACRR
ncbi:TlpA family protein disulfide reductase [Sphingomonas sp. 22176]|uniref:TlpA family protein disulfide reductase n=1 Tax=Sphingomonas sp. 22176 TaxID=3453884 RepID=UPI003F824C59